MSMRSKSKATRWKYDGRRGRKISKRLANVQERRDARKEIRENYVYDDILVNLEQESRL